MAPYGRAWKLDIKDNSRGASQGATELNGGVLHPERSLEVRTAGKAKHKLLDSCSKWPLVAEEAGVDRTPFGQRE